MSFTRLKKRRKNQINYKKQSGSVSSIILPDSGRRSLFGKQNIAFFKPSVCRCLLSLQWKSNFRDCPACLHLTKSELKKKTKRKEAKTNAFINSTYVYLWMSRGKTVPRWKRDEWTNWPVHDLWNERRREGQRWFKVEKKMKLNWSVPRTEQLKKHFYFYP